MASSPHCPAADRDFNKLRYEYTLPDILRLKEHIEIGSALETAVNLDAEIAAKKPTK